MLVDYEVLLENKNGIPNFWQNCPDKYLKTKKIREAEEAARRARVTKVYTTFLYSPSPFLCS